jgi:hypothetical protein
VEGRHLPRIILAHHVLGVQELAGEVVPWMLHLADVANILHSTTGDSLLFRAELARVVDMPVHGLHYCMAKSTDGTNAICAGVVAMWGT